MLNVTLVLPGKLTSVNKIYRRGRRGGVYIAPEVVKYRAELAKLIPELLEESGTGPYEGGEVRVSVDVYSHWYTKGGVPRVYDIDNQIKAFLDSVFPCLKINDKMVFDLRIRKRNCTGQAHFVAHIKEMQQWEVDDLLHGSS